MENDELDLAYFTQLLRKRALFIGSVILTALACFCALYGILPKKYKSDAQITIYSRYFQNPLVRDFISEQYDASEMRTQREALLQQAIDDVFVDAAANEFKLYRSPPSSPKRSSERAELRKQFEIFSVNSDSFQVGFISSSPQTSQNVAKKALDHVIQTLVDQRRKTIINVRDAIRSRMEAMVLFLNTGPGNLGFSSRGQVENQLVQLRAQIAALLQQYTEHHPKIVQLRARERVLEQYLTATQAPPGLEQEPRRMPADEEPGQRMKDEGLPPARVPPETLAGSDIEPGSRDVYQDLLKKYNYLNVALDMEQTNQVNYYAVISAPALPLSPVAPRLLNFLAYGVGAGILIALFALLFEEYVRFNAANAEKKAKFWGIPLLGNIPTLSWDMRPGAAEHPTAESLPAKGPHNDWN